MAVVCSNNGRGIAMHADLVGRTPLQGNKTRSRKQLRAADAVWPQWDRETETVRFKLPGTAGVECAIDREALEFLGGQKPLDPAACIKVYRDHRAWIGRLARIELAEDSLAHSVALGLAAVRFQLACESTDLPAVLCI